MKIYFLVVLRDAFFNGFLPLVCLVESFGWFRLFGSPLSSSKLLLGLVSVAGFLFYFFQFLVGLVVPLLADVCLYCPFCLASFVFLFGSG